MTYGDQEFFKTLMDIYEKYPKLKAAVDQQLKEKNTPHFWDIITEGSSPRSVEKSYVKMLSWLMDPTGNHGLGNAFVQALLNHVTAGEVKELTVGKTIVVTGFEDVDILYLNYSSNTVLALNLNSSLSGSFNRRQNNSQLQLAVEAIQKNFTRLEHYHYIHLSAKGTLVTEEPWKSLSYADLASILQNIPMAQSLDADKLIRDFIHELNKAYRLNTQEIEVIDTTQDAEFSALLNKYREFVQVGSRKLSAKMLKVKKGFLTRAIRLGYDPELLLAILPYLNRRHQRVAPFAKPKSAFPIAPDKNLEELMERLTKALCGNSLAVGEDAALMEPLGVFTSLRRTRKGQGLQLLLKEDYQMKLAELGLEEKRARAYISVDAKGEFPSAASGLGLLLTEGLSARQENLAQDSYQILQNRKLGAYIVLGSYGREGLRYSVSDLLHDDQKLADVIAALQTIFIEISEKLLVLLEDKNLK